MNCPKCGTVLADGSPFCSTCGANIGAPRMPAGMPPMPPMPHAAMTRTSGLAIAGFVCAFLCSLLGLILSILGLSEINKSNGTVTGRGLAIAGIVISSLSLVIGILAAVAIPAFMDYAKKSKKTEAPLMLNRIGKNAKVLFITNGEFPTGEAPLTPAAPCCTGPNAKCPVSTEWQTPAWQTFDFEIDEATKYQYTYTSTPKAFDAYAIGDLDCDGEAATYHMHVEDVNGNPTMTLTEPPPGVY